MILFYAHMMAPTQYYKKQKRSNGFKWTNLKWN